MGVISRQQAIACGLSPAGLSRWLSRGRLHRVHRGVYAVGHGRICLEGRLLAALLYTGRGSTLSHTTAAWWWGLLDVAPRRIHVSSPRQVASLRAICVHQPRQIEAVRHRHFPVTTVARTLLDLSYMLSFRDLRRALAEADYRRLLDPAAMSEIVKRGQPGSAALRRALADHNPRLALTFSVLEDRFLELCESANLPQPEVNATVEGLVVDALWPEQRLVVELDGHVAHATASANERDRHRDLILRAAGYRVLRYTWQQVTNTPELVIADLQRALDTLMKSRQ
jgi:Protein of unknown function (DUF559)/Transcriptional regulator, AbiEi antitoxin